MQRFAIPLVAGIAVIVLIFTGIFGGASLSQPTHAEAQAATPTATSKAESGRMLPAELQFLNSMTPEQRFDHFTGGQMTWVNPQGQSVVLNIIPGKVTAVTGNTVTIQPNGTTSTRTFNVTSSTVVRGTTHPGSIVAFAQGDRVYVTSVGSTNNAASITAQDFTKSGGYGRMPAQGMKPAPTGSNAAAATATPTP